LEKNQPKCSCKTKDPLPAKIIITLNTAEELLSKDFDDPRYKQNALIMFGQMSQEIRNELANREKGGEP
jgi:hypothetical protein